MSTETEHHGIAVARSLEKTIVKILFKLKLPLACVCTDDAGQYGRARRILQLRWPSIIFIPCFAHQANLIVGKLLRSSFSDIIRKAATLVKFFNRSSSCWLLRLQKEMKSLYGSTWALLYMGKTRWNRYTHAYARKAHLHMPDSSPFLIAFIFMQCTGSVCEYIACERSFQGAGGVFGT